MLNMMAVDKQDRKTTKGPLSLEEAMDLDKRRWELIPAKEYEDAWKAGTPRQGRS